MTSLVSCCARIVNQNKWSTLLHDRADVTVGYMLAGWRRIVELKTLAEQINACDGCDTPLNLMNIEQERLHGFGSYVSIRCTTIAVLFHLFHSPVALPFHPIQGKRRERLHDVLPIKIHCRVIWRRNWRCLGLSWKMHGFCSVAKKQAHVPPYFLLKF